MKRTVVRLLTEVVIGGMKYKTHGLMIHVSGVVLFTVLDVKVLHLSESPPIKICWCSAFSMILFVT